MCINMPLKHQRKKIYCFDLDGTLCEWTKTHVDSKPYPDRIAVVNKLYDEGNTIVIDTARGTMTGKDYFKLTEDQLKEWGVKYHLLRTGQKIFADYYIDDKGINDKEFFNNILPGNV